MTIPPFVTVEHDEASRKAYVTVEDKEVKKQREMWGVYLLLEINGQKPGMLMADIQVQHAHTSRTTS